MSLTSRARRPGHRGEGQASVEFGLVVPLFVLFVLGIVDFGAFFSAELSVTTAARIGARYAAVHPSSWDASASPVAASIQGVILRASGGARIVNDDTHLVISYYDVKGATRTLCGTYRALPTPGLVLSAGYATQASCLVANSTLVEVATTYHYLPITPSPIPTSQTTFTATTRLLEEQ